jgi:hypothetical protein
MNLNMNEAHLHLLLNHIPVFAVAFGFLAWIVSMVLKSNHLRWSAIFLFLLSAVSAYIASETGEGAEDLVETLPGVTKALIHEHEEAAELASLFAYGLAAVALASGWVSRFRSQYFKWAQVLVMLLSLVTIGLMARTAFEGGMIRHTEIRDANTGGGPDNQIQTHKDQESKNGHDEDAD